MFKVKFVPTAIVLSAALLILGGCGATQSAAPAAEPAKVVKLYEGLGHSSVYRSRMDSETKQMAYSVTTTMASAVFDESGKIKNVTFDSLEVVKDGEGEKAAVFKGWPDGKSVTDDVNKKDVANWFTKRERGDANYGLPNGWTKEVNAFQEFFKGKTVAEIEAWYAKGTSDANHKVVNSKSTGADLEKYNKLSDAEKKANDELVQGVNPAKSDTISGATISLSDGHGDFINALKEAYTNKVEVK